MEKNEFRIGNLVSNKKGEVIEIKSIDEIGINIEENLTQDIGYFLTHEYFFPDINPIKLTKDVMESSGFYENGIQHLINKWTCINFKKNLNGSYTPRIEDIEFNPIKYYHELQNFWKVLTGEELKKI